MSIIILVLSVALIIILTTRWNIHPLLALLSAALFFAISSGMSPQTIVECIDKGFGGTIGQVGLVIILGVIIGIFFRRNRWGFSFSRCHIEINW